MKLRRPLVLSALSGIAVVYAVWGAGLVPLHAPAKTVWIALVLGLLGTIGVPIALGRLAREKLPMPAPFDLFFFWLVALATGFAADLVIIAIIVPLPLAAVAVCGFSSRGGIVSARRIATVLLAAVWVAVNVVLATVE